MKDLRVCRSQKCASDPLFRLAMQESLRVRIALGTTDPAFSRNCPDGTLSGASEKSGPSTTANRDYLQYLFANNLDVHDLLHVDDRGRGLSGAIDCPELQHGTVPPHSLNPKSTALRNWVRLPAVTAPAILPKIWKRLAMNRTPTLRVPGARSRRPVAAHGRGLSGNPASRRERREQLR